jgi:hypothetical protein
MGTRVPAKQGAPLIISGSILTTDWLTPSNVGQGENYCKKFDPERFRGRYRLAADTAATTAMTDQEDATERVPPNMTPRNALSLHAVERHKKVRIKKDEGGTQTVDG